MIRYVFQVLSFEHHTPDVIRDVVRLQTIGKLLFPAEIPSYPGKEGIHVSSPDEFELSIAPEFYRSDLGCGVTLLSTQGVKLSSRVNYNPKVTPSNVLIRFTSEHLQSGIINLSLLKNLITEVVPVFRPGKITVYTQPTHTAWKERGAFAGPNEDHYSIWVSWLSYFSKALVEYLGVERFRALDACEEIIPIHDGRLVVLTSEPFDQNNESHLAREEKVIEALGLRRFLKTKFL